MAACRVISLSTDETVNIEHLNEENGKRSLSERKEQFCTQFEWSGIYFWQKLNSIDAQEQRTHAKRKGNNERKLDMCNLRKLKPKIYN